MGTGNLKKFFGDDRVHVFAGAVVREPDQIKHYFVNAEGNFVVSVEMHQHGTLVRANLSNQPGVWLIPDVGTEVIVASDNGDFEGELYLIGVFQQTSGLNRDVLSTFAPQIYNVVVNGNINLLCGPGSQVNMISDTRVTAAHAQDAGSAVARQSDIHDIWRYLMNQMDPISGHSHVSNGAPPTASGVEGHGASVPEPSGTQIFRAE